MPPRTRRTTTTKPSQATGEPTEAEVAAALDVLDKTDAELDEPTLVDDEENPIPESLQFSTAGKEPKEPTDDEMKVISIDGHELFAFKPERAAWGLLLGALSNSANSADRSYAVMELVNSSFDEPSLLYIHSRLRARGDAFDQELLEKIVLALIEEWAPKMNRAARREQARARR